jgi:hypothetical protein
MGKIRGEIGGEITGTVGDVTISTWKGLRVARRKRGPSAAAPSGTQKRQREQFAIASAYATEVGADPEKKALYVNLAKGQPTTWRALAVQDYLTPPVITRMDMADYHGHAGQRIDLFVHDATCERVHVKVLNPEGAPEGSLGTVVEEGEAGRSVPGQDFHWIYRAQAELPGKEFGLPVEDTDRPGNTSTVEGEV